MSIVKAFLYTILIFVFWSVIQIAILLPLKGFINKIEYNSTAFGIIDITSKVGAFLLIYFYFWKPNFNLKKALTFKNYNPNIYFYFPIIVIGLYLINRPFWNFSLIILDYFKDTAINKSGIVLSFSIYNIVTLIIVAPIIEELFYRKFLLEKLTQKNSNTVSLVVSSVCFSILHLETPNNLIPTFIAGIIFGLIYLKTRKIGYTIVLHFIFNFLFIISKSYANSYDNWILGTKFDGIYWLLFIIGIMITYLAVNKILSSKEL